MKTLMNTADKIRAAAIDYNRDFPECVAEVAAGVPQIRVTYGAKQGSRFVGFTVTAGIYCNGFIAAHAPIVHQVPHRDRRVAFSGCIANYANQIGKRHGCGSIPVVVIPGIV
jgi:hypothetical protein